MQLFALYKRITPKKIFAEIIYFYIRWKGVKQQNGYHNQRSGTRICHNREQGVVYSNTQMEHFLLSKETDNCRTNMAQSCIHIHFSFYY